MGRRTPNEIDGAKELYLKLLQWEARSLSLDIEDDLNILIVHVSASSF